MLADFDSLRQLSLADKLQLIDWLWDDIAASENLASLAAPFREEAMRRAAEMEADPSMSITEEELWRQVDEARG